MAVLVLGGYGLIGQAVVERLLNEGYAVIAAGRRVGPARRRWPGAEWREADLAGLTTPAAWASLLEGVDVVVNAAGLLQAGLADHPSALMRQALPALYVRAPTAGVRLIVQISASGVAADASTPFMRDKAIADAALLAAGLDAVILRPGLVISPTAYGGTAMLRGLAAFPAFVPAAHATSPVQTVAIEDVADAVCAAVAGRIPAGTVVDLVEQPVRSLADTLSLFRSWLGFGPAPVLALPSATAAFAVWGADVVGWLGWRSPLRSTAIAVIRDGVTGNGREAALALGRPLKTLPETLGSIPRGVQERWFARLWLLKPLMLGTLSAFWIASGAITLLDPGRAVVAGSAHGFAPPTALVIAGALLDIALGLAVLARPLAGLALKGMILTGLAYVAAGTLLASSLWMDPLGPLVKVLPEILLSLVALATLDDR